MANALLEGEVINPEVLRMLAEARMNELQREADRERLAREFRPGRRWGTFPLAALGLLLAAIGVFGRIA